MLMLTREDITNHPKITQYLVAPRLIQNLFGSSAPIEDPERLTFLSVMADIMRQECGNRKVSFRYMETNSGHGESLCVVGLCRIRLSTELYLGLIDLGSDPIEEVERRVRYFGLRSAVRFALMEGDACCPDVASRSKAFLDGGISMLYIPNLTTNLVEPTLDQYGDRVNQGGLVVLGNYNNEDRPEITEEIDGLNKEGWNVIGALTPRGKVGPMDSGVEVTDETTSKSVPSLFVMQKASE